MYYSNSNESGEFLTDGITQSSTTNNTFVQCTSIHLTSFAVLVDKSGENVSLSNYSHGSYLRTYIIIVSIMPVIYLVFTTYKMYIMDSLLYSYIS